MTTTIVMTAIGALAVAFLLFFFIELCREGQRKSGVGHLVNVIRFDDKEATGASHHRAFMPEVSRNAQPKGDLFVVRPVLERSERMQSADARRTPTRLAR